MNNVGATQELARKNREMWKKVRTSDTLSIEAWCAAMVACLVELRSDCRIEMDEDCGTVILNKPWIDLIFDQPKSSLQPETLSRGIWPTDLHLLHLALCCLC